MTGLGYMLAVIWEFWAKEWVADCEADGFLGLTVWLLVGAVLTVLLGWQFRWGETTLTLLWVFLAAAGAVVLARWLYLHRYRAARHRRIEAKARVQILADPWAVGHFAALVEVLRAERRWAEELDILRRWRAREPANIAVHRRIHELEQRLGAGGARIWRPLVETGRRLPDWLADPVPFWWPTLAGLSLAAAAGAVVEPALAGLLALYATAVALTGTGAVCGLRWRLARG